MSSETREWLANNVLVGFTEKRGNAWHYLNGDNNHYPQAIPVADVKRRLFHWTPVEGPVETTVAGRKYIDTDRKVIARPDTGQVLGVFKAGYQVHNYQEWLVENVSNILDADLHIGSAGLLKGGAVAWVQIELAETMEVAGLQHRPILTAATSLDGSLKTIYKRGTKVAVCDNTFAAVLAENVAEEHATKHSKKSLPKLHDIRVALDTLVNTGDAFTAAFEELAAKPVNDGRFERFVNALTPLVDDKGDALTGRGLTMAETKQSSLWDLWSSDPRVAPVKGTELGVVQAVNTYNAHESIVRGELNRFERTQLQFLKGQTGEADLSTVKILATV